MELVERLVTELFVVGNVGSGTVGDKGHATDFEEDEWFELMQRATEMKTHVERHSATMDRYDPDKRVALRVLSISSWGPAGISSFQ